MSSTKWTLRLAILAGLAGSVFATTQLAHAAGFALAEQNTSGLGNAYAGAAALADDASTLFFNSAGLTQLKRPSLVMNGAIIDVNSKFHNNGSTPAALQTTLGSEGGNAGGMVVVPALYVAVPLTDRVSGGVGVNAPFGLSTEYDDDFLGRFQAVLSDVKTTNINTALAFKLNNTVSLGIGANYQTLDATLTKNVNYSAAIAQASSNAVLVPNLQGRATIKGNDSAFGYDVGLLFNFNGTTKIGLSYRSAMKYGVEGNATFAAPTSSSAQANGVIALLSNSTNAAAPTNGPVTLAITLPATLRAALVQQVGDSVELMAEIDQTKWSSVGELRIKRPSGATLTNTPENFKDTLRYAVGANFKVSDGLKLRVGAAKDESPVRDLERTPRLPDGDRTWLTAGAQVKLSDRVALDVGYANIKVKDAALNQNDGNAAANGLVRGTQKTHINILGAQATVSF